MRPDKTDADNRARPRNGRGRFVASLDTAARDAEAARMRVRAVPLAEITERLGFSDMGAASHAISRALRAVRSDGVDEARRIALDRLEFMYSAALAVMERHHYTVSQGQLIYLGKPSRDDDGRVVRDPKTGKVVWDYDAEPLADDGPVLQALDRMLRVEARRAAIEGFDAPAKSRVEVTRTDGVDSAVRDLMEAMERRDPSRRP